MRPAATALTTALHSLIPGLLGGAFVLLGSSPAQADTCTMRDGREIHGRLIRETKDHVFLRIADGGTLRIEREFVVSFVENDNYGFDYGRGGIDPASTAATPTAAGAKSETGSGSSGATAPKTAGSADQKALEAFAAKLPKPSEKLSELDRQTLLERLYAARPQSDEWLEKTKASGDETLTIDQLAKKMGVARKVGNRGARDLAADQLAAFDAKALPALSKALSDRSPYARRNAAQVITKILKRTEPAWAFYLVHFKLGERLVANVAEQADIYSYAVRDASNTALEAIFGGSIGFEPNSDQFRTPGQAECAATWANKWTARQKEFALNEAARAKEYDSLLEGWKQGTVPSALGSTKTSKPSGSN
jgi:hypothetical protein